MIHSSKLIVVTLGCTLTLLGIGCHTSSDMGPKTDGEKIAYRAKVLSEKAEMTQKGERMIADGNAMVAKGKSVTEQGQTIDGQKMVIDGEAKVREGSLYIRQANEMVLPDAPMMVKPATQPSGMEMRMDSTTRPATAPTM